MMIAKSGFQGVTLAVALVLASGGMLAGDAVAQDNAVSQGEAAARDDAAGRSVTDSPSGTAASPPKSDLDRSGVRVETVIPVPRPILTSTRSIIVPKILGSYR
jgi:hypothetical protein